MPPPQASKTRSDTEPRRKSRDSSSILRSGSHAADLRRCIVCVSAEALDEVKARCSAFGKCNIEHEDRRRSILLQIALTGRGLAKKWSTPNTTSRQPVKLELVLHSPWSLCISEHPCVIHPTTVYVQSINIQACTLFSPQSFHCRPTTSLSPS